MLRGALDTAFPQKQTAAQSTRRGGDSARLDGGYQFHVTDSGITHGGREDGEVKLSKSTTDLVHALGIDLEGGTWRSDQASIRTSQWCVLDHVIWEKNLGDESALTG